MGEFKAKTFEELFENPFNPHLEIIHFVKPIIEKQPEIEIEFTENLQKQTETGLKKIILSSKQYQNILIVRLNFSLNTISTYY